MPVTPAAPRFPHPLRHPVQALRMRLDHWFIGRIPPKDSTTLSWTADNDAVGSAAIPKDQFNQYVREGKIRIQN